MRVTAVVVTYNRKELLVECLEALARQTHALDRVIVVDNASTDGTLETVEASGIADRLPLDYLRVTRNGGGAEGFHYGVRAALDADDVGEWIWLMDDDCEPADDSLEKLLASKAAADPATSGIAPRVHDPQQRLLPMHRGHIVTRPVRAPISGATAENYGTDEAEIDFFSFVGPLFRASVCREMGAPDRRYFIRFEDLEYSARAAQRGRMWLVNDAVVVHKENVPLLGLDPKSMWENFSRKGIFRNQWMGTYGLRNIVNSGRRYGYVTAFNAFTYVLVQLVRIALFDDHKVRTMWSYALYAYDGWRGLFRNLPPPRWAGLADADGPVAYLNANALRYDADVSEPVRRLTARPTAVARATPAA